MALEAKERESSDTIYLSSKGSSRPTENSKNKKEVLNTSTKFTVLYTNAECLLNKRSELVSLLSSLNNLPQVIAITEFKSKKKIKSLTCQSSLFMVTICILILIFAIPGEY